VTVQLIINDEARLRGACLPARLAEGRELARKLSAWLDRNNKKASKPLTPDELKTGSLGQRYFKPTRPALALGVAAPQLGVARRVAVARPCGRPYVLINPRVVARSDSLVPWTEGCMSFPGREVDTYRRVWVEVAADNWPGTVRFGPRPGDDWTAGRLLESVCVQHEIGHLAGLLFFDFQAKDGPDPLEWFK
jgi:peptide deformylase